MFTMEITQLIEKTHGDSKDRLARPSVTGRTRPIESTQEGQRKRVNSPACSESAHYAVTAGSHQVVASCVYRDRRAAGMDGQSDD